MELVGAANDACVAAEKRDRDDQDKPKDEKPLVKNEYTILENITWIVIDKTESEENDKKQKGKEANVDKIQGVQSAPNVRTNSLPLGQDQSAASICSKHRLSTVFTDLHIEENVRNNLSKEMVVVAQNKTTKK